MNANTDSVINQLFSGGTALAGLILVFLGGVLASFDSYAAADKNAVRKKYRTRAWLAILGFGSSLLAAVFALVANWHATSAMIICSIIALGLSFALLVIMALGAVVEI
jgi:hypothetical protein